MQIKIPYWAILTFSVFYLVTYFGLYIMGSPEPTPFIDARDLVSYLIGDLSMFILMWGCIYAIIKYSLKISGDDEKCLKLILIKQ